MLEIGAAIDTEATAKINISILWYNPAYPEWQAEVVVGVNTLCTKTLP